MNSSLMNTTHITLKISIFCRQFQPLELAAENAYFEIASLDACPGWKDRSRPLESFGSEPRVKGSILTPSPGKARTRYSNIP